MLRTLNLTVTHEDGRQEKISISADDEEIVKFIDKTTQASLDNHLRFCEQMAKMAGIQVDIDSNGKIIRPAV